MSQVEKNAWGPGFCALLYLLVHFIPDFGGADVMGAQWLYVSLVDFAILAYILKNKQQFKNAIDAVLKLKFTIVYSFLVIWALLSLIYSINAIETLVCLARLVSTYLIFINLSILFYKKEVGIASVVAKGDQRADAHHIEQLHYKKPNKCLKKRAPGPASDADDVGRVDNGQSKPVAALENVDHPALTAHVAAV